MNETLREQIVALLRGGNAHMPLGEAVADFPMERINDVPPNGLYSSWHLLEHIRRTQRDILDFMTDPNYKEQTWPDAYWPAKHEKATAAEWNTTLVGCKTDHATLVAIAENPAIDYFTTIPWGTGQNILREFLLVADHNAYHIGELGALRQIMQTWSDEHDE